MRRSSKPWQSVILFLVFLAFHGLNASCSRKPPTPEAPPTAVSGASLYAVNCALCHGPAGMGNGPAADGMKPPPPKLDQALLGSRSRSELEAAIRQGVMRDGKQTMPPARDVSDPEIAALVDYLWVLAKEK